MTMKLAKRRFKYVWAACLMAVLVLCFAGRSHALLLIDNMIFMGERDRSAIFKIKNTTNEPRAYTIEWVNVRMNPDGTREVVEDASVVPGLKDAAPYIYVAPRRMFLQPGQLQSLRFMLRRTQNMEPGEYRTYLYVKPEEVPQIYNPNNAPGASADKSASVKLNVLTGYRIPVFFLNGETTLNVSIENARLVTDGHGNKIVHYTLRREGTRSAVGKITIYCDDGDRRKVLGRNDVKIFTEVDMVDFTRKVVLPQNGCQAMSLDFTPHRQDPLFNHQPLVSVAVAQ